jgi:hypothetical protein
LDWLEVVLLKVVGDLLAEDGSLNVGGAEVDAPLLTQSVKANPQHSAISMRVAANNPAVRLYERFGFKLESQTADSVTLRREV